MNGNMKEKNVICTVIKRNEKEALDLINDFLKRDLENRNSVQNQNREGNCFDTALKGSKVFLKSRE